MLILTRRIGESVQIGSDVRITVLWHRGPQVALGICAPKSIEVHRQEVFDRIQQQRATSDPDNPAEDATTAGSATTAER